MGSDVTTGNLPSTSGDNCRSRSSNTCLLVNQEEYLDLA